MTTIPPVPGRQRPPQSPHRVGRLRGGRLLVECLVAALLLATIGLLVGALARGRATAIDTAHLTTSAWALGTRLAEGRIASGCAAAGAFVAHAGPRVAAEWAEAPAPRAWLQTYRITMRQSPLIGGHLSTLDWRTALDCP